MKRVLVLSSSPYRGGSSDTLCDEFLRGAIKAGNNVEKIFLRDKVIYYCTGCSMCSLYDKPCPQEDDTTEVIRKMLAADVIVMNTPVYFYAMSAQMKALIDRCCSQYIEMTDREFYLIVTVVEDDWKKMLRTIDTSRGFLDCLENPMVKGIAYGLGVWHTGEIGGNPAMRKTHKMNKGI